ncbi:MAG: DUF5915 domain-containing protein, partial [Dehalococcoidales bacterium]|nr:DUF5915 domain-containing protein [Dehalococcoidales bacterium]
SQAGIKVRQPLAAAYVSVSKSEKASLERVRSQILEELNVKDIQVVDDVTTLGDGYVVSSEGSYSVAVSTAIAPDLIAEGMAREVVHRLQTMRRNSGFEIADHIVTYYQGDDFARQVMTDSTWAEYIKQETLSLKLVEGIPEKVTPQSFKLDGHQVTLAVEKAG